MKRSRMQTLGTWATQLKVIAAASLLNTSIYIHMPNVEKYSNGSSIHHRKLNQACIKLRLRHIYIYIYIQDIKNILSEKVSGI